MRPLLLVLPLTLLSSILTAADNWRPVDSSELSQKKAKVEPGADAEAIFWDVRIEDSADGGEVR
jgi:hypothetical protein